MLGSVSSGSGMKGTCLVDIFFANSFTLSRSNSISDGLAFFRKVEAACCSIMLSASESSPG